jgi:hypothetical protein
MAEAAYFEATPKALAKNGGSLSEKAGFLNRVLPGAFLSRLIDLCAKFCAPRLLNPLSE